MAALALEVWHIPPAALVVGRRGRAHTRAVNDTRPNAPADAAPEDLLRSIAAHQDRDAFAALFRLFAPKVKAYMMRLGTGDALAEDLIQDVMIAVWNRAGQFDPAKASLATWIYSIARNRRIDVARRDRRIEFDGEDPVLVTDEADDGFHRLAGLQDTRRVRAAMEALPEDQARVLRLSFYEDKAHSEIAAELRLPLGTVKSRIRLAMEKLRLALGDI